MMRIGIGHDTHRLTDGGPLILGGVSIAFDHHLVGHSDADVLLHAVTDALLGAAGLGDIGEQFPDDDPLNKDRDSAEMLCLVRQRVVRAGFRIHNVDCTVFAERPKLAPHKPAIRQRIAGLLEVTPEQVNVKAKTGELVGPVGRREAIVAQAIALISVTT